MPLFSNKTQKVKNPLFSIKHFKPFFSNHCWPNLGDHLVAFSTFKGQGELDTDRQRWVQTLTMMHCYTLFEKSNFCPKIQFWQNPQHYYEFFTHFFLTIFLVKSKLSTSKEAKTKTLSRVFHPKKIDNFSPEIKVEFLDKKWRFRTVCNRKKHKLSKKSFFLSKKKILTKPTLICRK